MFILDDWSWAADVVVTYSHILMLNRARSSQKHLLQNVFHNFHVKLRVHCDCSCLMSPHALALQGSPLLFNSVCKCWRKAFWEISQALAQQVSIWSPSLWKARFISPTPHYPTTPTCKNWLGHHNPHRNVQNVGVVLTRRARGCIGIGP